MHEHAATRLLVHQVGIRDIGIACGDQPAVAVDASVVGEIQHVLGLARRIGAVIAVVGAHGDHHALADRNTRFLQVQHHGQVAARMLPDGAAVDEDLAAAHDGFEMQEQPPAVELRTEGHVLAVPGGALVVAAAAALRADQGDGVREVHQLPTAVVESGRLRAGGIPLQETPPGIEVEDFPPAVGKGEESRRTALLGEKDGGEQAARQDRGHLAEIHKEGLWLLVNTNIRFFS